MALERGYAVLAHISGSRRVWLFCGVLIGIGVAVLLATRTDSCRPVRPDRQVCHDLRVRLAGNCRWNRRKRRDFHPRFSDRSSARFLPEPERSRPPDSPKCSFAMWRMTSVWTKKLRHNRFTRLSAARDNRSARQRRCRGSRLCRRDDDRPTCRVRLSVYGGSEPDTSAATNGPGGPSRVPQASRAVKLSSEIIDLGARCDTGSVRSFNPSCGCGSASRIRCVDSPADDGPRPPLDASEDQDRRVFPF